MYFKIITPQVVLIVNLLMQSPRVASPKFWL
jgi:hypothetical protein